MVLKISLNFFRYRDHGKIDHYHGIKEYNHGIFNHYHGKNVSNHGNSYFTIKKPAHLNEPVFAVYFLN